MVGPHEKTVFEFNQTLLEHKIVHATWYYFRNSYYYLVKALCTKVTMVTSFCSESVVHESSNPAFV